MTGSSWGAMSNMGPRRHVTRMSGIAWIAGAVLLALLPSKAIADGFSQKQGAGELDLGLHVRHLLKAKADPTSFDAGNNACCSQLAAINFKSNLPVVVVDTQGQKLEDALKPNSTVCTCGSPGASYAGPTVVYQRGGEHTQAYNTIQSYALRFPVTAPFLGLPADSKFALYGPQNDSAGLHQWLAFNLSRAQHEYASRTQYFELFIVNDSTPLDYPKHYRGIYLLLEPVAQGKHKVAIEKHNTSDVAGSYIVQYTHSENLKNQTMVVPNVSKIGWVISYPAIKHQTVEMAKYIEGYMSDFENALFGPQFLDTRTGWQKYANITTFVDWFLNTELFKNTKHGYHGSSYMYKDVDGVLNMGPSWSHTKSFGFCCGWPIVGYMNNGVSGPGRSGGSGISPNGWLFSICDEPGRCSPDDAQFGISLWFRRLWQDPVFQAAVVQRYRDVRAAGWSNTAVLNGLLEIQATIEPAMGRTFAKWGDAVQVPGHPQPSGPELLRSAAQDLLDWTVARLEWLDGAVQQVASGGGAGPFPASYAKPAAGG